MFASSGKRTGAWDPSVAAWNNSLLPTRYGVVSKDFVSREHVESNLETLLPRQQNVYMTAQLMHIETMIVSALWVLLGLQIVFVQDYQFGWLNSKFKTCSRTRWTKYCRCPLTATFAKKKRASRVVVAIQAYGATVAHNTRWFVF